MQKSGAKEMKSAKTLRNKETRTNARSGTRIFTAKVEMT